MSNRCVTAVFEHSQSKGSQRLVLLAMADEASDEGMLTAYRRSLSWLAHKANVDKGTAKRAIAGLVELGEVVVLAVGDGRAQSDYQLVLAGLKGRGGDPIEGRQVAPPQRAPRGGATPTEGARPDPPHHPGAIPVGSQDLPADGGGENPAHNIVRAFYDWCTANSRPKPTLPAGRQGNQFMALVHIVEGLLAAGWPEAAVKRALTCTRAFTTDALTFALNEDRQARAPGRPIEQDRERESGSVDQSELWGT